MKLTFWGTRGSVPCFSSEKVRFGTNTSCIEVKLPGRQRIVFDAGTGVILLGDSLVRSGSLDHEVLHLFFSHFHWDHINGLPFFKPSYRKGTCMEIYGRPGVDHVFTAQLQEPFSPIPLEALTAQIHYNTLRAPVKIGPATITPFSLNHPQGCNGYVVKANGKKLVYATDTEPDGGEMDDLLLENAQGADMLVMDSNNSLDEARERKGWGHSTWRDCVRLAREAGVTRLILFHHDAHHNDEAISRKEVLAQREFPETVCAYDGLKLSV
jgi:phosphoribosyl 1,2-cyclic phosphodiesterase